MRMNWATWLVAVVTCCQVATGQEFNNPPRITPRAVALRVVKTAGVGTELTRLTLDDNDGPSAPRFIILDPVTSRTVQLIPVDGRRPTVRVLLNTSLQHENVQFTKVLHVIGTDGLTQTTATITLQMIDPVSPLLTGLNDTGLIPSPPDVETVISNMELLTRTLCRSLNAMNPVRLNVVSRFRLFCLLFQTVYTQFPSEIFTNPGSNLPPRFIPSSNMTFYVREDTNVGAIIGRVTATDYDGPEEIQFRTISENVYFGLGEPSGSNGQWSVPIILQRRLDGLSNPRFEMYISADDGLNSKMLTVIIEVQGTFNTPPSFSQRFYNFSIFDSAEANDVIGRVYAKDPDNGANGKIDLRIINLDPQISFLDVFDDGTLVLTRSVSNLMNRTISAVVVAQDGGGKSSSADISVSVIPEPDGENRTDTCLNGGVNVTLQNGTSYCYCRGVYFGPRCQYNNQTNTCLNGGVKVTLQNGTSYCYCRGLYYGPRCQYSNQTDTCLNGGFKVTRQNGTSYCYCRGLYYGPRCQYSNNTNTCLNGGSYAVLQNGTSYCYCRGAYYGPRCQYSNNTDTCLNGGSYAVLQNGTSYCYCRGAYYGPRCQYRNNTNTCLNGGSFAVLQNGTSFCYCRGMYYGPRCQYSNNTDTCLNGGSYVVLQNGTSYCYCFGAYYGPRCQYRNNTNTCLNGGSYVVLQNGTSYCYCRGMYYGPRCQYSNDTDTCLNGGSYAMLQNGTSYCYCFGAYYGPRCQYRNNTNTCLNGGSFAVLQNGTSFCYCRGMYYGPRCQYSNNTDTCLNGGSYVVLQNGTSYCYCFGAYYGPRCQYRNNTNTCLNGGSYVVLQNGTSYCYCRGMYYGPRCQYSNDTDTCLNGGSYAMLQNGTSYCYCFGAYYGPRCQYSNNTYTCLNGGSFARLENGISVCYCRGMYYGPRCQYSNNTNTCLNGGSFAGLQNGTSFCYCSGNYYGSRCQYNMTCLNGGVFIRRRDSSVYCNCIRDYYGSQCQYRNNTICLNAGVRMTSTNGTSYCQCRGMFYGSRCQYYRSLMFRQTVYTLNISEGSGSNYSSPMLQVDDMIQGLNTTAIISLRTNDTQGLLRFERRFSSASATWTVNLGASLDREQRATWWFSLEARTDNRTANATLIVNVLDVNDNSPRFPSSLYTASVLSDDLIGTQVLTVRAFDPDNGANGSVSYSFLSASNLFSIDSRNGQISVASPLTNFVGQTIQLIALAQDGGLPTRRNTTAVVITIRSGDGRLRFATSFRMINISESRQRGFEVIRLPVGPVAPGRTIMLSSSDRNNILWLSMDSTTSPPTAVIRLNKTLDRERNANLSFTISASDGFTTARIRVTLNITDVNDNTPVFYRSLYNVTIRRDIRVKSRVFAVSAHDLDAGENGTISYIIMNSRPQAAYSYFSLNRTTGMLTVNRTLYGFNYTRVNLTVMARDGGKPSKVAFVTTLVNIRDAPKNVSCTRLYCYNGGSCAMYSNGTEYCVCTEGFTGRYCSNSTLRFRQNVYSLNVSEAVGGSVLFLVVVVGDNRSVTLQSNDSQGMLNFVRTNRSAWAVFLRRPLDREQRATWWFGIQAREGIRTTNATLILHVLDVNDNTPQFSASLYRGIVLSDDLVDTHVMTVTAFDPDNGANGSVSYSFLSASNLFNINKNGEIKVAGSLTNFVGQDIRLTVVAQDGGKPSRRDTTVVVLAVRPGSGMLRFGNAYRLVNVSESRRRGFELLRLLVGPLVPGRTITLSSNDQNHTLSLSMDSTSFPPTAVIRLNNTLDRERNRRLTFLVKANDGFSSTQIMVVLNITDVNDSPPVFLRVIYNATVTRNMPVGGRILVVAAHDLDAGENGTISYYINSIQPGTAYSFFSLNKTTGLFSLSRSLYSLTGVNTVNIGVTARDGGNPSRFAYARAVVNIQEANVSCASLNCSNGALCLTYPNGTAYCQCAVGFTGVNCSIGDGRLRFQSTTVTVNVSEGYHPEELIRVFDVGPQTLRRISVSSNDTRGILLVRTVRSNFNTKVYVYIRGSLDREQEQRIYYRLLASDGAYTASMLLVLNVTDINDNSPQFSRARYDTTIFRTLPVGGAVLSVSAVDIDAGRNGTVNYTIVGGSFDYNLFNISSRTGLIQVRRNLNFTRSNEVNLNVQAQDGGVPSRKSTASVVIAIQGPKPSDMPPDVHINTENVTVRENAPPGSVLTLVRVTDDDSNIRDIRVTILNGDGQLAVRPTSSMSRSMDTSFEIYLLRQFNREVRAAYQYEVVVSDGVNRVSAYLYITILDVNDEAPVFSQPLYEASVPASAQVGDVVTSVYATDLDMGLNAVIVFSIIPGSGDAFKFNIDERTGRITLAQPITEPTGTQFAFEVQAKNLGFENVNALQASALVEITVTSAASNKPPTFSVDSLTLNISRQTPVGTVLGQLTAFDSDGPQEVYFQVEPSTNSRFISITKLVGDSRTGRSADVILFSSLAADSSQEKIITILANDGMSNTRMRLVLTIGGQRNPPVFNRTFFDASVSSDASSEVLLQAKAVDPDGDGVVYSLTGYSDPRLAALFTVDRFGFVRVVGSLQSFAGTVVSFDVLATDQGNPPMLSKATVRVNVSLGNNPPVWVIPANNGIEIEVDENTWIGAKVYEALATDQDNGANGQVNYFFSYNGNTTSRTRQFRIDPITGAITTLVDLRNTQETMFMLALVARDRGDPPRQISGILTFVIVGNRTDTGARFEISPMLSSVNVLEHSPIGLMLTRLTLTGVDNSILGYRVRFYSDDAVLQAAGFTIREGDNFVNVLLNTSLDRETSASVTTTLTAVATSTQTNDRATATCRIVITVLDINDNAPVFSASSYTTEIPVDIIPDFPVVFAFATDSDVGENGRVVYSIPGGSNYFRINATTGSISVVSPLAALASTTQSLTILATDGGTMFRLPTVRGYRVMFIDRGVPPQSSTALVRITIGPNPVAPDNIAPAFNQAAYIVTVPERFASGTRISTFTATDSDGGEKINFALSNNNDNQFALAFPQVEGNQKNISLISTRNLDRETRDTYILFVIATDGRLQSTATVSLSVVDNNDNAPVFNQSSYTFDIASNVSLGANVGAVSAADRDSGNNARITYAMENNRYFTIDPVSGSITTLSPLASIASTVQQVTVRASDSGTPPRSTSVLLVIRVTGTDDPANVAPEFNRPSSIVTVQEDVSTNTAITALTASDSAGGNNIQFSLLDNVANQFRLGLPSVSGNQKTISLITQRQLDRETIGVYRIYVVATDGQLQSTATVTVSVVDVNDNPPVFGAASYEFNLPVTVEGPALVGTVQAFDSDLGDNADVSYRLQPTHNYFFVSIGSGGIYLLGPAERFAGQTVNLTVVATDNGFTPLSSSVPVRINVISNGDNAPPTFIGLPSKVPVDENTDVGTRLMIVTATDMDGPAGRVTFDLPDSESFETVTIGVEAGNGNATIAAINLRTFLDREQSPERIFLITASDGLNTVTGTVTLVINDRNDNAPVFSRSSYSASVSPNSPIGTNVTAVSASDPDAGLNSRITYSIQRSTNPGLISIDASTGMLRVASTLPAGGVITLRVEARDAGTQVLNASVAVTLTIQNGNTTIGDNKAPVFTRSTRTVSVAENNVVGSFLAYMTIRDEDGPGDVSVRVVGDRDAQGNYIARPGFTYRMSEFRWMAAIVLNTSLDREQGPAERSVLVIASDGATESTATVTVIVENINDNTPVFSPAQYTVSLSGIAPAGTPVIAVQATDRDVGIFGQVSYRLMSAQYFTINGQTGEIRTSQNLPELTGTMDITVIATDGTRNQVAVVRINFT